MTDIVGQYALAVVASWLALIAVAMAFTLQFSVSRYYDMTQALAISVGGYAALTLSRSLDSIILIVCIAAAAGALTSLVSQLLIHEHLLALSSPPLMHFLASIGITIAGQNVVAMIFGDNAQRIVLSHESMLTSSAVLGVISLAAVGAAMVVVVGTRVGRGARYVAADSEVAASTGINVRHVAIVMAAAGGALMGVAGAGVAIDTSITPTSASSLFLDGAVASLLRRHNTAVSLLVITGLLVICKQLVVFAVGGQWQEALTYALFVVAVISRGPLRLVRWG